MRLIAVTLGLALLSLAFAPAPFPKAARRGGDDEMSLRHFQGKWTHVRIETVGPNGERSEWKNADVVAVRVKGDQWIYLAPNDRVNSTYTITVKEARGPAAIDWYSGGTKGGRSCSASSSATVTGCRSWGAWASARTSGRNASRSRRSAGG
jgi:uncharacterized protein (TIGR03067 family)